MFEKEAWPTVLNRVKIAGILAMFVAAFGLWRTRASWWRQSPMTPPTRGRMWLLIIGGYGLVWWLIIAFETQAGFSGNNRYLVFGTAPVAIAGGVGWGWAMRSAARGVRWLAERSPRLAGLAAPRVALPIGTAAAIALFLAVPPWIGKNVISLPRTHHALVYQAHLRDDLNAAVAQAGGAQALLRCGSVMTEGFQVPMVAWTLGVRTLRVEAEPATLAGPPWPNVILQTRAQSNADAAADPGSRSSPGSTTALSYTLIAHVRTFRVFSTCAR